ncbi:MAG TPA: SRPBCC domain-containing protein [Cytophagales bacterium]|nr:SRPBCC domain-containing protein [Cytophagales bacterium]HAA22814.1 SRPBCC domain-containing protein [Cytophagales bacterium]HAP65311.1 SRPBCC domain-containing protein [Cytophagales bacterium]
MKQLETTIDIQATPNEVWNTLLDFGKYSEWNPFIRKVEGNGATGTQLRNTMHLPGQKPQVFTPKVLVNNPTVEFRWLGRLLLPRVFDGEHYFKLTALPNGGTRLVHGEVFRGMLVNPIMRKIGKATEEGFEAMNQALKDRLEK